MKKYEIGDRINLKDTHPELLEGFIQDIQLARETFLAAAEQQRTAKNVFWDGFFELFPDAENINWRVNQVTGEAVAINTVEKLEAYKKYSL